MTIFLYLLAVEKSKFSCIQIANVYNYSFKSSDDNHKFLFSEVLR